MQIMIISHLVVNGTGLSQDNLVHAINASWATTGVQAYGTLISWGARAAELGESGGRASTGGGFATPCQVACGKGGKERLPCLFRELPAVLSSRAALPLCCAGGWTDLPAAKLLTVNFNPATTLRDKFMLHTVLPLRATLAAELVDAAGGPLAAEPAAAQHSAAGKALSSGSLRASGWCLHAPAGPAMRGLVLLCASMEGPVALSARAEPAGQTGRPGRPDEVDGCVRAVPVAGVLSVEQASAVAATIREAVTDTYGTLVEVTGVGGANSTVSAAGECFCAPEASCLSAAGTRMSSQRR